LVVPLFGVDQDLNLQQLEKTYPFHCTQFLTNVITFLVAFSILSAYLYRILLEIDPKQMFSLFSLLVYWVGSWQPVKTKYFALNNLLEFEKNLPRTCSG